MTQRADAQREIRVVVNADDYGYFDGVSRGILRAATSGALTAVGVMANGPAFARWAAPLADHPQTDVGVHLNITYGEPLSAQMRRSLAHQGGRFSSKLATMAALIRGQLPLESVLAEWRAQVQRCLDAGLEIRFLNSHEHVHMLPQLRPHVSRLASEFGIVHVRDVQPEWEWREGLGAVARSAAIAMTRIGKPVSAAGNPIRFLGLAPSGRLSVSYLTRVLPRLRPQYAYELMCHPGEHDSVAASDVRLRNYHDWEGELDLLLDDRVSDMLAANSVRRIRFRDINLVKP